MAGTGMDVVAAREYAAHLLTLIPAAKKRIVLAAMTVRAGTQTGTILRAMADAARRGVQVHVVADVFCQHLINRPDYLTRAAFRAECAETREILAVIHAQGGTVTWVGRMGLNPYAGRYHAKATIVDDHVFSFGGVNFADDALDNIDYMLYGRDATLASRLEQLVAGAGRGLPAADIAIQIAPHGTLLFDAGIRGTSLIYHTACELAARSTAITYVSQMCPSGRLGQLMKATKSTCYFNRPFQTGMRPDSLAQLWDGWRTGIPNHNEGEAYIHAKCMLFELPDGSKAVLSGSHNFSWRGVAFGTREIALHSTDETLWQRMQDIVYQVATSGKTK